MLHVLAVLTAAVLFGTTGTAQALGPEETTPLSVGVMRLVVGGIAIAMITFPLAARRIRRSPAPRPASAPWALAALALTAVALAVYQPLFFLGTARNGVAVGTVVALGSAPILAGVAEWALTRRRPTGTWIAATALATVGVAALGLAGGGEAGTDPAGLAGSLGAGASFAAIAVAQRRLLEAGWDPFLVVGVMGAGAGVIALGAVPFIDLAWLADPTGMAMAVWLGVATIAAAYTLFTWGLSGLTAATAATLTLGEPLTATLLGVVVLGEHLPPPALLGLVVLGAGLALLAWGARAPRDPAPFAVEG
ncbi:DMT family transporter [Microbacterium xanthum]|uniref:DMT family transporter n=1 Tax=Microbacterium xanthum TaxID=3079794 RepID=UPI002AD41E23|nr:EamA family transporter [Microbacterium sp. KSW-48]MDZ8171934.1 EamA family transporter [Microbacterium sp. KSW-48]